MTDDGDPRSHDGVPGRDITDPLGGERAQLAEALYGRAQLAEVLYGRAQLAEVLYGSVSALTVEESTALFEHTFDPTAADPDRGLVLADHVLDAQTGPHRGDDSGEYGCAGGHRAAGWYRAAGGRRAAGGFGGRGGCEGGPA